MTAAMIARKLGGDSRMLNRISMDAHRGKKKNKSREQNVSRKRAEFGNQKKKKDSHTLKSAQ